MKNHSDYELCDSSVLERPRYFPRQMITADEMTLEQHYFRDKMRRHNRLLHGWGVVCDAKVCPVIDAQTGEPTPWLINVTPGYILGPYGDEIVIDCQHSIDLRSSGTMGMSAPSSSTLDPWCSNIDEVLVDRRQGPVYIAVRYREVMTRPVRVQPVGCGCDDQQCEYSRWRDGYEIGILTDLPPSHNEVPPNKFAKNELPTCPPCPSDPWVVLAEVSFDSNNGAITQIDNHTHRRLVLTFSRSWWKCVEGLKTAEVSPKQVKRSQPAGDETLQISGGPFRAQTHVSFGRGIRVKGEPVLETANGESHLKVVIQVDPNTDLGFRKMTITDQDCNVLVKDRAIEITAAES
jgi:hypothetical protein